MRIGSRERETTVANLQGVRARWQKKALGKTTESLRLEENCSETHIFRQIYPSSLYSLFFCIIQFYIKML